MVQISVSTLSDEVELKCTSSDQKNCNMWSSVYAMCFSDCDHQRDNTKLMCVCLTPKQCMCASNHVVSFSYF